MKKAYGQYDWRTLNRFLGVAALVAIATCIQWVVRPTVRIRAAYHQHVEGNVVRQARLDELDRLRSDAKTADESLKSHSAGMRQDLSSQSELEQIAQYASRYGAQVRNLPIAEKINVEAFQVAYAQYRLEGSFITLIQFLHDIERAGAVRVTNVNFTTHQHSLSRLLTLHMQMGTARISK